MLQSVRTLMRYAPSGLLTAIAIAGFASQLPAQTVSRLPSDVLHDVAKGRLEHLEYTATQVEAALKPLLENMRSSGLSADEEVARGLAYYFTFDGATARPILEASMRRDE